MRCCGLPQIFTLKRVGFCAIGVDSRSILSANGQFLCVAVWKVCTDDSLTSASLNSGGFTVQLQSTHKRDTAGVFQTARTCNTRTTIIAHYAPAYSRTPAYLLQHRTHLPSETRSDIILPKQTATCSEHVSCCYALRVLGKHHIVHQLGLLIAERVTTVVPRKGLHRLSPKAKLLIINAENTAKPRYCCVCHHQSPHVPPGTLWPSTPSRRGAARASTRCAAASVACRT